MKEYDTNRSTSTEQAQSIVKSSVRKPSEERVSSEESPPPTPTPTPPPPKEESEKSSEELLELPVTEPPRPPTPPERILTPPIPEPMKEP